MGNFNSSDDKEGMISTENHEPSMKIDVGLDDLTGTKGDEHTTLMTQCKEGAQLIVLQQGTKQDEQTSRDNVNYLIDRSSESIQFNKEEQTGDGKTGVDVDRDRNNSQFEEIPKSIDRSSATASNAASGVLGYSTSASIQFDEISKSIDRSSATASNAASGVLDYSTSASIQFDKNSKSIDCSSATASNAASGVLGYSTSANN